MTVDDMQRTIHLDRVALDGFVVRRRSATLRWEPRDLGSSEPGLGWHAYIACASLPVRFQADLHPVLLDATLPDGRTLSTAAIIVERRDDAYGTVLLLTDPSSGRATASNDIKNGSAS
jgi:hypothetical protein